MNLFCVGISGASLMRGVRRHTHVAYRFLTTCLFVGIYVTVFIDPVLGLTSGTGGTRAAMSPYHLVTWVLGLGGVRISAPVRGGGSQPLHR